MLNLLYKLFSTTAPEIWCTYLEQARRLRLVSPQHFNPCDDAYRCRAIRIRTTLYHIRFANFTTISKITKEIFVKIYWQLKTPTRTWKRTRCIMQLSYLYKPDFPFETFCKLAQHVETIRKNVWERSNYAHSLSIRVQTTFDKPHFNLFLTTISMSKKVVFFNRELKKALRDT